MKPWVSRAASQSSKLSSSLSQEEKSGSVFIQQYHGLIPSSAASVLEILRHLKQSSHWTHVKLVVFKEDSSSSASCTIVPVSTGELDEFSPTSVGRALLSGRTISAPATSVDLANNQLESVNFLPDEMFVNYASLVGKGL